MVSYFQEDSSTIFAGTDITTLMDTENELRGLNENLEQIVKDRPNQLYNIQCATIHCLAWLAELRDHETGAHIERTKSYVKILVEKLKDKEGTDIEITDEMIEVLI